MARAIFGLLPLVLIGCFLESDPDAPVTRLSNVTVVPTVSFSASRSRVRAAIEVDPRAINACVTLDDEFQSTLNGVPMAIQSRGGSGGSIGSSVPCYPPVITARRASHHAVARSTHGDRVVGVHRRTLHLIQTPAFTHELAWK